MAAIKDHLMSLQSTVSALFGDVAAFVEKAAPNLEQTIVNDAKNALGAAEAAFTPVADAAVTGAVNLITSKYALNAPFSATEVAFLKGIVAELQALLPSA